MTWKLNVDGIHGLKPIQNKDCVLGVLRSKTNNILSPGVKIDVHERQILYPKVGSKHPSFQNISNVMSRQPHWYSNLDWEPTQSREPAL